MSTADADFQQRCSEVELYLAYLLTLEGTVGMDVTLMATMKASALLMIYNLVESTATNAIESIFDYMKTHKIGFVAVDDKLKTMILKCAKDRKPETLVKDMRSRALDLAVACFKKDEIFSGNVDSRKIREVWGDFGVKLSGKYSDGALLEVKTARNDLAHGAKSFSELGKDQTASALETTYLATKLVLKRALVDIDAHLQSRLKVLAVV